MSGSLNSIRSNHIRGLRMVDEPKFIFCNPALISRWEWNTAATNGRV
jgi:hypothetical protein